MTNGEDKWEQFLEPEFLKDRLISAALFLIAFEFLKESIIGRAKQAYAIGFDESGLTISSKYTSEVLSLDKNPINASLKWLEIFEVIDEDDYQKWERIRKIRNTLAHELLSLVTTDAEMLHIEGFHEAIELLDKIEKWWIVNFEIPSNPDFDNEVVNTDGIVCGPVISMRMMIEVLSGNTELLDQYRAARKQKYKAEAGQ